jgi:hypothetical protein
MTIALGKEFSKKKRKQLFFAKSCEHSTRQRIFFKKTIYLPRARASGCHTWFSKEQNQANHMCAQEIHTYVRMKKYQK